MSLRTFPDYSQGLTVFPPGTGFVDPLEGIDFSARWQSHRGDDVSYQFYTDVEGTVPAVEWDPVAAWRDGLSGGGLMLAQSNPDKRPLLVFDGNGHPCLEFDGIDDVLDVPAATTSGASALTAFASFAHNASPPSSGNASGILDNWGNAADEDHLPYVSNTIYHGFGSTDRRNALSHSETLTVPCVATFISDVGDWRLYLNESLVHLTFINSVGIGTVPKIGGNDGLAPGGAAATLTTYFSGRVYAVSCLKRVATTEERELIISYLAGLAQ